MTRLAELRHSRRANWIAGGVVLLFAILLPLFLNPLNGFIDRSVIALAYVVMALGLNVVVGFAGLLDLGYVAFYAIGAYSAGWFASDYFSGANNSKGVHILDFVGHGCFLKDPGHAVLYPADEQNRVALGQFLPSGTG